MEEVSQQQSFEYFIDIKNLISVVNCVAKSANQQGLLGNKLDYVFSIPLTCRAGGPYELILEYANPVENKNGEDK